MQRTGAVRRLHRMSLSPKPPRPLVAIIGTTGVGKSQLAVSLAQHLRVSAPARTQRGTVLSADAMQLYQGLDVITNKITENEMGGIEHWGLNMVKPTEGKSWEVGRWCTEADKKISSFDDATLPIICGGTHYFIQHFLFPPHELSLTREPSLKGKEKMEGRWTPPGPLPSVQSLDESQLALLESFWQTAPVWPPVTDLPTDDHQMLSLFRLLQAVDPREAGRWHWRDERKVRRGLERWWEQGLQAQPSTSATHGRRARFRTLVFWVYQPLDSLRPRLDERVENMLQNGLLREIAELRDIDESLHGDANVGIGREGIFQSIGYKEFAGLDLRQHNPELDVAFPPMLERMKLSTRRYALSQLKWIKKQFLPAAYEARRLGGEVWLYVIPGGSEGTSTARLILDKFLEEDAMPDPSGVGHSEASVLLHQESKGTIPTTSDRQEINARLDCDVCSSAGAPYSALRRDWQSHLKSKLHKRNLDVMQGGKERRKADSIANGERVREQRAALAASKVQGGGSSDA